MTRINVVYQNNNMPGDILPDMVADDSSYTVVWSRAPQPGVDAVVYFNHYTFNRRKHDRICPDALKILYIYEPAAVDPIQYTRRIWEQFDEVLTWNTYLTESSPAFTFEAGAYYDLPYPVDYGVAPPDALPDPSAREKALCQICSDKYSIAPGELYSERRRVARWFHQHGVTRMDVFGLRPMNTPNYRGLCRKRETLSRYRYALCFENTYHPQWSRGYVSEKIFDCMALGVVPVYYGCSNVAERIPETCFIDFRNFDTLDELDTLLQEMSDEEYLERVDNMAAFFQQYNPPQRHSVHRMYETVAALLQSPRPRPETARTWPPDFQAVSTWSGNMRFALIRATLPYYSHCYKIFDILRFLKR